jgi:hypothetical protein
MPGYGLVGPEAGTGLLPWKWAHERLVASHDYRPATVRPDGRAHLMPIWGTWEGTSLWFSSAPASRKAANLRSTWFALRPVWAFALDEDDFTGSPTRWSFPEATT